MAAFSYTAINSKGGQQRGVIEGDTPRQVRAMLRKKGLAPTMVEEISQRESSDKFRFHLRKKINPSELALVTRQLATLIRSGTVLEESLKAVADQNEQDRVRSILLAVRAKVVEGHSLAIALAQFPSVFSELYRATVAAGEQTGFLDLVFERLADYAEFSQHLRQKMMLALLYPVILTLVAISVVIGLMVYVVPQVVKVFDNMGQDLPMLTRSLIAVSAFLKSYGVVIFFVGLVLFILVKLALRREEVRFRFHRLLINLPLFSKSIKTFNAARFARTFSILIASGVSILEGLQISAQVVGNLVVRQAVSDTAVKVREGASLSKSLAKCGFFPPITIHMIASGEASSKLEEMLERAATIHEREMETMMAATLGIFEPMLILVMGGVVLVIVLAILMPIFDLNQLVH